MSPSLGSIRIVPTPATMSPAIDRVADREAEVAVGVAGREDRGHAVRRRRRPSSSCVTATRRRAGARSPRARRSARRSASASAAAPPTWSPWWCVSRTATSGGRLASARARASSTACWSGYGLPGSTTATGPARRPDQVHVGVRGRRERRACAAQARESPAQPASSVARRRSPSTAGHGAAHLFVQASSTVQVHPSLTRS